MQALVDETGKLRKEKENRLHSKRDAKYKQKSTMNKLYSRLALFLKAGTRYVPRPLKRATTCLSLATNRKGIIITPPDNSGMCFIQAGIMKTKIDVKKLQLIEKQQPQKQTKPSKRRSIQKAALKAA